VFFGEKRLKNEVWGLEDRRMTKRTNLSGCSIIAVFLLGMVSIAGGRTIYVDVDAASANDGSSWTNAYNDLQDGLTAASSGDEIRVAQGVYRPSEPFPPSPPHPAELPLGISNGQDAAVMAVSRTATFMLRKGVAIRGGYAGFSEPVPDARNIKLYETILSGDLAGNDRKVNDPRHLLSDPCRAENCYHVVMIARDDETVLDGLTITGGNDNGSQGNGGGLHNFEASPILINCIFSENSANRDGGGIANFGGSPTLINCIFSRNSANHGGGMYNRENISKPILLNCIFSGNTAGAGGGMYNWDETSSTLTNCTFAFNSADNSFGGGGMWNQSSSSTVNNCIFWGNSYREGMDEVAQIIQAIRPLIINYTCVQGWTGALGGTGNIGHDPAFVKPGYWDANGVRVDGDYHLLPNSPCIDAGDNSAVPLSLSTDLDGNPRIVGGTVDMGVYEFWCPSILHVDDDATGANDGSSWADAFNNLQDALAATWSGDEIRVAQGIYKPAVVYTPPPPPPPGGGSSGQYPIATAVDREATFQLINGVTIKGGYAGAPDPNSRDIQLYETILSGDLAGNDVNVNDPCDLQTEPTRSENSYHVVRASGTDETAVLDGFTITGGARGGMYNLDSSPTVSNCTFSNNSASGDGGGGMYNHHSSPLIANCTFIWNSATGQWSGGGGMYNSGSSPTLTNCTFNENSAKYGGGGMYNWYKSQPALTNCIFINNSTERTGGGICNRAFSNPKLTNCTFISNSAHIGGGMFIECFSGPTVINCTFTGNSAGLGGGGIYSGYTCPPPGPPTSLPVITNCILYGNTPDELYVDDQWTLVVAYSDVQYSWPGEGNIDSDPLFVEPSYWDANGLWVEGNYHLLPVSPCIDAGDPDYVAGPNETDLDGKPRVIGGRIDMGAYESQNVRPVANAGPDQIVECACNTNEGTKVTLDGTGSYDIDGDPLIYTWTGSFIESPAHGATPTITLDSGCPGEYVITLVVNDGMVDSEPNDVLITVVDTTPPVIVCPVDATLECPVDTSVEANGSATATDNCDDSPEIVYSDMYYGTCTKVIERTWTATDTSGNSSSCVQVITVADTTPPVITCPADVTLECPADMSVEANGSATAGDTCGAVTITHSDAWQAGCGNTGALARTWTATDECGNSSSCVQTISVVDTTPPEFALAVSPTVLWPANHKMVLITPSWTVSDKCDATPEVSLVSILVNEAGDTKGAGNTSDDIQIGDDGSIYLRAERSGAGKDRVYTITYRAVDDCGNSAESSATVTVPHDQR